MVNMLLNKKANPNETNNEGVTPRIPASRKGCLEWVKSLIASKAKVDIKDDNSGTALSYAKSTGNQQIIDVLLQAGAK